MRRLKLWVSLCLVSGVPLPAVTVYAARLAGVIVKFERYDGPAKVEAHCVDRHKLRIDVDPRTETNELLLRVEVPATGHTAWPAADVEVRNARDEAVVVRRSGLEWHKLLIPVPALADTYTVQAVDPPMGKPPLTYEKDRRCEDPTTGLSVSVARWYDGRQAALSLRFDDSHPTHLANAIPILRQHGLRGTFMVNPGSDESGSRRRSEFQIHRAEWEAVGKSAEHEFANHTLHHRGAIDDDDMEAEIGEAAQAIWKMTRANSKLTALNLGGGTQWTTSRTLRYYLDKYHQFDVSSGSLGMDDSYGNRVSAFRRHLERHIEGRGWCRTHFHSIGEGLSSSEANFEAVLEVIRKHEAVLWVAGMADIYKYQTERNSSTLSLLESRDRSFTFRLSYRTDPEIYDQPLTIEVTLSESWPSYQLGVRDSQGGNVVLRKAQNGGQRLLRFELPPHTAEYAFEWSP